MSTEVEDLDQARRQLGLSHYGLWVRYLGLGGTSDAHATRNHLTGRDPLPDGDHDRLVTALNEACLDTGDSRRLPYRRD